MARRLATFVIFLPNLLWNSTTTGRLWKLMRNIRLRVETSRFRLCNIPAAVPHHATDRGAYLDSGVFAFLFWRPFQLYRFLGGAT